VTGAAQFGELLELFLLADPWVTAARSELERWLRLGGKWEGEGHLRLLFDTPGLASCIGDDAAALKYLVESSPREACSLVRTPFSPAPARLGSVPELEFTSETNRQGSVLETVTLPPSLEAGSVVRLGSADSVESLAASFSEEREGRQRSLTALAGAAMAHLTVTADPALLSLNGVRPAPNVVTARAAAIAFGLHARRRGRVPMPGYLHITRDYFHEDRTLALVPEIATFLQKVNQSAAPDDVREAALRLAWATADRLAWMGRAEDEIGMRDLIPTGEPTDREILYHFEYLLLLSRAVIEGLGRLAVTLHGIDVPARSAVWGPLRSGLKDARSPLLAFLDSTQARQLNDLVSRLRAPLAHAARWPLIHRGSPRLSSANVVLSGEDAALVAEAIEEIGGDLDSWGMQRYDYDAGRVELHLDPYPFAVHLSVHLMSLTGRFLDLLAEGAQLPGVAERPPWEFVNPPLDEPSFDAVRIMSWPLPSLA
jgi:hypothetical protein